MTRSLDSLCAAMFFPVLSVIDDRRRVPASGDESHAEATGGADAAQEGGAGRGGARHVGKLKAAWLACLFGVFGLHWWYLRRRYAWVVTASALLMLALSRFYSSWWENPPMLLLLVPALEGVIEALVFALKPDAQFDARYNPASGRATRTGWNAVLTAIFATVYGVLVLTWGLAFVVMYVYETMGWLDGLVY